MREKEKVNAASPLPAARGRGRGRERGRGSRPGARERSAADTTAWACTPKLLRSSFVYSRSRYGVIGTRGEKTSTSFVFGRAEALVSAMSFCSLIWGFCAQ